MGFFSEKFMRAVLPSLLRRSSPDRQVRPANTLDVSCSCSSASSPPAPRDLLDVVHQAVQLQMRVTFACPPSRTHLRAPSEREAVQPLVVPQVRKHRLDGCNALAA